MVDKLTGGEQHHRFLIKKTSSSSYVGRWHNERKSSHLIDEKSSGRGQRVKAIWVWQSAWCQDPLRKRNKNSLLKKWMTKLKRENRSRSWTVLRLWYTRYYIAKCLLEICFCCDGEGQWAQEWLWNPKARSSITLARWVSAKRSRTSNTRLEFWRIKSKSMDWQSWGTPLGQRSADNPDQRTVETNGTKPGRTTQDDQ